MEIPRRPITVLLIATLTVLCVPISAQNGVLNCASNDGRYHYCRADTQNRVRLVQQFSNSPCSQGYSWGFDYRGIWVDRGCRAQFEFGRRNDSCNTGAAVAAGVIEAIIIGAAVASANKDNGGNPPSSGANIMKTATAAANATGTTTAPRNTCATAIVSLPSIKTISPPVTTMATTTGATSTDKSVSGKILNERDGIMNARGSSARRWLALGLVALACLAAPIFA